jgi:hypothetical protein
MRQMTAGGQVILFGQRNFVLQSALNAKSPAANDGAGLLLKQKDLAGSLTV